MAKPGVMIYFDLLPALRSMTLKQKGELFQAIMDYAYDRTEPEMKGFVGMAWHFVRPNIDRDSARYDRIVMRNCYARYAKRCKKEGVTPKAYGDWCITYDPEKDGEWEDEDG